MPAFFQQLELEVLCECWSACCCLALVIGCVTWFVGDGLWLVIDVGGLLWNGKGTAVDSVC